MLVRTHGFTSNQLKNYRRKQDILRQIIKSRSSCGRFEAFFLIKKFTLSSLQQELSCSSRHEVQTISGFRQDFFWLLKNFSFPFFLTVSFSANFFFSSRISHSLNYNTFKCYAVYMDDQSCGYLNSSIDEALSILMYSLLHRQIHLCRFLLKCSICHNEAESLKT